MRKSLLLSFVVLFLAAIVIFAAWYVNEKGEMVKSSRDAFIPYNSAVVVHINPGIWLPEKTSELFGAQLNLFKKKLFCRVADTLVAHDYVSEVPRTYAMRLEGKRKNVFLLVMENRSVLSRTEVADALEGIFSSYRCESRRYNDKYTIWQIGNAREHVYYAVEAGMILLSDSELYIEDALRQAEAENNSGRKSMDKRGMKNVNRYFSPSVNINVFLNTSYFSDILPRYLRTNQAFKNLDITKCFDWGALDGDLTETGLSFSGFMQYDQFKDSYMKTLENQYATTPEIENIIPSGGSSYVVLALSDLDKYLYALENYRHDAGLSEKVRNRRQNIGRLMGKTAESSLLELIQGEFALINTDFNAATGENEGAIIVSLKSGSLCRRWLEDVANVYAQQTNQYPDHLCYKYEIDQDNIKNYYRFPSEDAMAVYFGYLFEGIKTKYAFVEDNYLVLASSERVVSNMMNSFFRQSYMMDTEWYRNMRNNISTKYNLAYFADMQKEWAFYKYYGGDEMLDYLRESNGKSNVLSYLTCQWSNEGEMLYASIFAGTQEVVVPKEDNAFQLWQVKMEGGMSMKPVLVTNHNTGEREIFVQDNEHNIYLVNNSGKVLWKRQIDGKILSPVTQIDVYKNNKLQYIFSTSEKIYVIDRNGNPVEHFPLQLPSDATHGITVCDYEKTKDYRIFAPCNDKKVYLYDIEGKQIEGWNVPRADKQIVTPVRYFNLSGKDYIVFADKIRLYVLDRRGKERVNVSSIFDLGNNSGLYLTRRGSTSMLVFSNVEGPVNMVDFTGNVQTVRCQLPGTKWNFNVGDVNGDGTDELLFTGDGELVVFSLTGRELYREKLGQGDLDFPYIYRFSGTDIRVGLLDKAEHKIMLVSPEKGVSSGFPMDGVSPFSVFVSNGTFFFYTGAEDGSLIKFRTE